MIGISLITATGGRPEAFALCERWISRQDYVGPMEWIVVDDVDPPTEMNFGQITIRPPWRWRPGQNTQGKNILIALEQAKYDKILIIEDDDYYDPSYVDWMARLLDDFDLVGEANAIYYHLPTRGYRYNGNYEHASLCQTGFNRNLILQIKNILASKQTFFDIEIWKLPANKHLSSMGLSCGMKGLPGRPGIGRGHHPVGYKPDSKLEFLYALVGDDIKHYLRFT